MGMTGSMRGALALLAAALLWGCEHMGGSGDGPTMLAPEGERAMGVTAVADLEAHWTDSTAVYIDAEGGCELRVYRAAGGHARAQTVCGEAREAASGHWSVLGNGAHCLVWRNSAWGNGCYAWEHLGGGRYGWTAISGDAERAWPESQDYAGNAFGL